MRRFSRTRTVIVTCACLLFIYYISPSSRSTVPLSPSTGSHPFSWRTRKEQYPVERLLELPTGKPQSIPQIQYDFQPESESQHQINNERRVAVEIAFNRCWEGYRHHAWLHDELVPVSGGSRDPFGGWGATLVDSLDTLWIMGLKAEFEEALEGLKLIDFTTSDHNEINIFEATIRYLGGLLGAHDLTSGDPNHPYPVLLEKAIELGDMLYAAFDTPNRMPIANWKWKDARSGQPQEAPSGILLAEIGSLSLEFTRLSQLTGNSKYFDAIQRINNALEEQQPLTKLPGLWPINVNAKDKDFTSDTTFSMGAMSDSTYEYLPKQFLLLGGLLEQPKLMYQKAIEVAKSRLFFRPMEPNYNEILLAGVGSINTLDKFMIVPKAEHLSCFVGGMMGMAAGIFSNEDDLVIAGQLVNGCIWAYQSMPTGIMPEIFYTVPCNNPRYCQWDLAAYYRGIMGRNIEVEESNVEEMIDILRLPPGITDIPNRSYVLRPEAIESMFILYRITCDESLRESAWEMFQSIEKHTTTEYGNTALDDVTVLPAKKGDSMQSFWTAETLKYFYLIFSPPDLVSLDDYVFNTEAHPFRRPR